MGEIGIISLHLFPAIHIKLIGFLAWATHANISLS